MNREELNELYGRAKKTMQRAYNPYSKYNVGFAILTETGKYYAGCNVENAAYGRTICSEANAVSTMVAAEGAVRITQGLLIASGSTFPSPCGSCRQIIAEFSIPETKVHLVRQKESSDGFDLRTYTMSTLLPLSFTQQILWEKGAKEETSTPLETKRKKVKTTSV